MRLSFFKLSFAVAFGVILGVMSSNFAMSALPISYKIAVVDVQKVVNSSSQVQAFKGEQKKKLDELSKFVSEAKTTVAKETDETKRKTLEEKYNKEFAAKKAGIEKDYVAKITKIDSDIAKVISEKAKSGEYNIVLAKPIVLWGGDDITNEILKAIK